MFWKRKPNPEQSCAHTWRLVDYESGSINGLEFDDYFVLHCEKCGAKRRVDDYEYGKLREYGLIKEDE